MAQNDVIIAGFGGQGVLLSGKLLAWAGMLEGLHVTWFPSYGAEMRGGTANCTVIMSEREIGSPVVDRPGAVIAFNQASAEKFIPRLPRGGLAVVNSSLCGGLKSYHGVRVVRIPANEISKEIGEPRVLNIVMLGAYLRASGAIEMKSIASALEEILPERRKNLLPLNMDALRLGFDLVR